MGGPGREGPKCLEGAEEGDRGSGRVCDRTDRERREAGTPPPGQRASGGVILPFSIFQFLSAFWIFFFFKGGWFLHFHSLTIGTPGYKRSCNWLLPLGAPGPSSNCKAATRKF